MPTTIDASFIDSLPPNVAVQFLERVAKSAQREAFRYPDGDAELHARISLMTCPCTSVSRRSMPLWRKVSFSWLMPSRWRIVAWKS